MASDKKEKKQRKKYIGIIIAVIVIIAIIIVLVVLKTKKVSKENEPNISVGENGIVNNISKKVYETKNIEATYEVTCKSLKYDGSVTKIGIKLKNVTGAETKSRHTKIVFVDKNNNEISNMSLYVRGLKVGEEYETTASIGANIVDAYDYKIIFVN